MILVDRILSMTPERIETATTLPTSIQNRLSGDGAAWTLEIAAQSCAILISSEYRARGYQQGRLIKSSSWRMTRPKLPESGTLVTETELEGASEIGLFLFNAKQTHNGCLIAEGQFSILAQ